MHAAVPNTHCSAASTGCLVPMVGNTDPNIITGYCGRCLVSTQMLRWQRERSGSEAEREHLVQGESRRSRLPPATLRSSTTARAIGRQLSISCRGFWAVHIIVRSGAYTLADCPVASWVHLFLKCLIPNVLRTFIQSIGHELSSSSHEAMQYVWLATMQELRVRGIPLGEYVDSVPSQSTIRRLVSPPILPVVSFLSSGYLS